MPAADEYHDQPDGQRRRPARDAAASGAQGKLWAARFNADRAGVVRQRTVFAGISVLL
ncbi:hypothetical protein [Breoghania sp.]|uniref:hypothetical protein n=1 Tax=Breoghania sp. TaxID=2065378 RepID=UPI00260305EC|nr:hypothetical protein [Breoghania sp.]MDJ0932200.1 hypothetical protein [Breoghania sp.]